MQFLDWSLVEERVACSGEPIDGGKKSSASECAESCRGVARYFTYGRRHSEKCDSEGCRCFCQSTGSNGEACQLVHKDKFDLYQSLLEGMVFA